MRSFLLIAVLVLGVSAQAQDINLEPTGVDFNDDCVKAIIDMYEAYPRYTADAKAATAKSRAHVGSEESRLRIVVRGMSDIAQDMLTVQRAVTFNCVTFNIPESLLSGSAFSN